MLNIRRTLEWRLRTRRFIVERAVLNATGTVQPRREVSRRGVVTFVWDNGLAIDAQLQLADAQIPDLLEIAGQQQKIPVTGTIAANAHVTGTIEDLEWERPRLSEGRRRLRRIV